MENAISSETCKNCAECCKHYSFVELSQIEINALEKLSGLPFEVFTYPKGEAVEEYFLKFKENGDCYFLNANKDNYSCGVYEARAGICINYPSDPSQNEACDANRKIRLSANSG
jgi:Fe-S-cluster containining protein